MYIDLSRGRYFLKWGFSLSYLLCARSVLWMMEVMGSNAFLKSAFVYGAKLCLPVFYPLLICLLFNMTDIFKAFILFFKSVCWDIPSVNLFCIFSHLFIVETMSCNELSSSACET